MPLILVVEQDEGVLERVLGALGPEGWRVVHARGVTEAMGRVASEAPDLFLVSTAVERAEDILGPFARLRGGPGTLALIPEQSLTQSPEQLAGGSSPAGFGADGVLSEPFADADLREAVSRILRGADRRRSQQPGAEEPKLTSADIFGELVAEVEKEARDEASSRGRVKWGSPPAPAEPAESAEPRRPARGARNDDDEIERKLEQTLSGVLGPTRRPAASPGQPPPRSTPPSPPKAAGEKRSEVDELISKTLSGLDLGGAARRKRPETPAPVAPRRSASPPEPPAETRRAEPFDLADLEEMIRTHKAPSRRTAPLEDLTPGAQSAPPSGSPAAPAAEPAAPAPPVPEPPPAAASEPAVGAVAPPAPDVPVAEESVPGAPVEEPVEPEPPAAEPATGPGAPVSEPVPDLAPDLAETPAPAAAEAPKAPSKDSVPGVEFGQYRLLERIGVGGMAEVWKARMTGVEGFQKTVAIKKILPHLTDSPAFVDMFIDEAKLAAQLSHANIIHIYDLGKIDHDYYIAMEYVEGANLRNLLNVARERGKPVPIGLALFVAARLASALDHAHHKRDFEDRDLGLVHRDVSPQNVLIGYEGTIKLCDFGIVKAVSKSSHTQMGALKGKLQYMSPEQAWGKMVDGRSDIFAVGGLLFEMLTGRRLFAGDSEMEVLEAVRECRIQKPSELRPEVSDEVDALVLKALEAEPGDRFQSAGELSRRLEELLTSFRPAPGQAELAAYVAELFDRGPATAFGREPSAELPPREATGTAAPAGPAAAAATAAGAEAGTGAGSPAAAAGGVVPVQAVEPVSEVEPEEGGRRGKGFLVAAILVALLAGALLVWYVLRPKSDAGAAPGPEVPAQTEGPAAPEGAQTPGSTPEAAQGAAQGAAQVPNQGAVQPPAPASTPGSEAPARAPTRAKAQGATTAGAEGAQQGPTPEVAAAVDRALKERMAQREKELRSQFEAEERRLKDQLDEIQKKKPAPGTAGASPPNAAAPAAGASPTGPAAKSTAAAAPKGAPSPAGLGAGSEAAPGAGGTAASSARDSQEAAAGTAPSSGPSKTGGDEEATPKPVPAAETETPRPAPKPEPPPAPRKPAVKEGELVTDGPGVVRPQVVTLVKPEYPPMARRLRVEGEVVVSVLVDETGRVVDTRLDKRVPQEVGLNEAALEAARKARFRPATKNGVRVKMWTTISFPFKL